MRKYQLVKWVGGCGVDDEGERATRASGGLTEDVTWSKTLDAKATAQHNTTLRHTRPTLLLSFLHS